MPTWQQLAEGNAKQARKRVAADVIIRDEAGRLLLVDPNYKPDWDLPDWDLPGGMAEANEPPRQSASRELREELGLELPIGPLVCIDGLSSHGPWGDSLMFVFDGGVLDARQISGLKLVDEELSEFRFFTEGEASTLLRPYVWRRVEVALDALPTGRAVHAEDGHAVDGGGAVHHERWADPATRPRGSGG
jgi:ADP-ribose pyrophosphatase YjhB (NUDIX family)